MNNWESIRISDVCEFKYGKALKSADRHGGDYPVYGSSGTVGFHSEYLTQKPTIIIGRKGSVGEIYYTEKPCWPIDTAYYLEYDSNKVHIKWFAYLLKLLNLKKLDQSAAIPGLNRNDVYKIKIKLPPLPDQIRIATILNKADALTAQRKESIRLLDELLKSAFAEMFGDHKTLKINWAQKTLPELSTKNRYSIKRGPFGGSLKKEIFVNEGFLVYEQYHAINDDYSFARYFITPQKYEEMKEFSVKQGDLLISCSGSLGQISELPKNAKPGIINQALLKLSLDSNIVNTTYFKYLFRSALIQRKLFGYSRGSGIPNFPPMTVINSIKFPTPPIDVQIQFAQIVEKVEALKVHYKDSLIELANLYGSLSQKAFKGELDLSLMEVHVSKNKSKEKVFSRR